MIRALACFTLVVVMAGCGQQDDPGSKDSVDESREPGHAVGLARFDVEAYADWRPTYRDVRRAAEADAREIRSRMRSRHTWTARIDALSAEISATPDHVRVRMGDLEVHLRPSQAVLAGQRPVVVCLASESACVRVPKNVNSGEGSHLFNGFLDGLLFTMVRLVSSQLRLPSLEVDAAVYAHVDSPVGKLDCLITGGSPEQRHRLEGKVLDPSPELLVGEDATGLTPFCVDSRGLVLVPGDALMPLVPFSEFRPEVEEGFDAYPWDVIEYGEPLPTLSATPSPTEEDSPGLVTVLVANQTIEPGETLEAAMAAGKIGSEFVSADVVEAGAVDSTDSLGAVALVRLEPGDQLTTHDFGPAS